MLVLGIETTCDETAASIVEDGNAILSNVIASQVDFHKKYGGVFPELATRLHINNILPVIEEALAEAKIGPEDIDLISVAKGPGLIGALLIGLTVAKTLSFAWQIPFIGVNHIEAHLYAAMMTNPHLFPAIGLVVSGGHTELILIREVGYYELIGKTQDDAIGECFDKAASILGLTYPGGPAIEILAKEGNDLAYPLKSALKDSLNFSFSGLKTKILYTVKGQGGLRSSKDVILEDQKKHLAASFQRCAFLDVIEKSLKACKCHQAQAIYIGGGVSINKTLRSLFLERSPYPLFFPKNELCLDNAAMIAGLGCQKFRKNPVSDPFDTPPLTKFPLY